MDVHHPSDSGCVVSFSFTACSGHHVSLRLLSLHSCNEYLSLPKKKKKNKVHIMHSLAWHTMCRTCNQALPGIFVACIHHHACVHIVGGVEELKETCLPLPYNARGNQVAHPVSLGTTPLPAPLYIGLGQREAQVNHELLLNHA